MSVKRNLVSRLTRTRLLFPLLLIVLLLPALYFYATRPKETAAWWNESWIYRKRIDISTYSFSLSEIHILQKCFKEVFNIEAKYYSDRGKGYRMYFNQEETKKLIKIIRPYIIPSMRYKIGFRNPVTT